MAQMRQQQEAAKTLLNIFSDDTVPVMAHTGNISNNVDLLDGLFDIGVNLPSTPVMKATSSMSHSDLMGNDLLFSGKVILHNNIYITVSTYDQILFNCTNMPIIYLNKKVVCNIF